ncbi:MAG: imidazole glycerol phosphate synthase subunit HisH [Oscillospiraceae bacterium]|nr:imidazole glycerol phosphate synthase subunit HisH [Oscillospiraceae bacterium]
MIAIVDYGVGNLFSLVSSLRAIGQQAEVTSDPAVIAAADRVILPGVGAFGDAVEKLDASGLRDVVLDCAAAGKPLMGICLGMQMLFEKSFEFGEHAGLGLLKGEVVPMEGRLPTGLKIPHIGWNALRFEKESPLFKYIREGDCVYFVHSFYAEGCADSLIADTEYGRPITAAVQRGNVFGCQFHPEKSGTVGLNILKAFCEV